MTRPPQPEIAFEELPDDPQQRHEALVAVFGQYMFWLRNQTLGRMRRLVENSQERDTLGRLFRETYEEAARLHDVDRERAYRLVEQTLDVFGKSVLTMVAGQGFDDTIGPRHVFRFRVDMEICEVDSGHVVFVETISRDGEKFFPEYWGRWLNRYASVDME